MTNNNITILQYSYIIIMLYRKRRSTGGVLKRDEIDRGWLFYIVGGWGVSYMGGVLSTNAYNPNKKTIKKNPNNRRQQTTNNV